MNKLRAMPSADTTLVDHAPGLLQSPVLAHVPHAFTTRIGGVSSGAYASLNFGSPNDLPQELRDSAANIDANVRRVLTVIRCPQHALTQVHQVHGSDVLCLSARQKSAAPSTVDSHGKATKADALVTNDDALAVAVRVADCGPILLATRDGSVVGAVHAGWRGVASGVICRAMEQMVALHAQRACTTMMHHGADIVAAIGPCLSAEMFEVGDDVRDAIVLRTREHVQASSSAHRIAEHEYAKLVLDRKSQAGKPLVDLVHAMMLQLRACGAAEIDTSCHACTYRDEPRFFSHRRDAGRTGRMLAVVAPRITAKSSV